MKRFLFLTVLMFAASTAFSQYKWDYGIALGGANYLGDIGGKEQTRRDFVADMHLNQTNIALGGYARYKFSKRFSLLANLTYLQINDADRESTNPARRARNLNFRNRMVEFGARGELTVFYDPDVGGRGYYNPDFKLYVFAGVAGFYHNPQAQLYVDGVEQNGGAWYDLAERKTEGQSEPYSNLGVAIPAGMGVYFTFNKTWRFGWELGWRATFTDYLDDISTTYGDPSKMDPLSAQLSSQTYQGLIDQINDPASGSIYDHMYQAPPHPEVKRGDPTHNDSYMTMQFSVGRVIRGRSSFYRKKYSWLKNRSRTKRYRAKF